MWLTCGSLARVPNSIRRISGLSVIMAVAALRKNRRLFAPWKHDDNVNAWNGNCRVTNGVADERCSSPPAANSA